MNRIDSIHNKTPQELIFSWARTEVFNGVIEGTAAKVFSITTLDHKLLGVPAPGFIERFKDVVLCNTIQKGLVILIGTIYEKCVSKETHADHTRKLDGLFNEHKVIMVFSKSVLLSIFHICLGSYLHSIGWSSVTNAYRARYGLFCFAPSVAMLASIMLLDAVVLTKGEPKDVYS